MSLTKTIFKNVSYLLIAKTAFRFLTAVVLIYAANWLGADRFGQLETATAWANTFLAVNDLGMSVLIVREAARDEKKMAVYFGNTLIVEVILSLLLYGLILGIGFGAHYDSTTMMLIAIMGAAGLIYEFRKVMRGIFRVLMKLKFVAFLEILNGLLYLLTAFWIFSAVTDKDLGLLGLAHARLWVNVVIVALLFLFTLRVVRPRVDLKQIVPMIKKSYLFTLYNIFFMLYFQIDQIIISFIRDDAEVGVYGAPAKIIVILFFIPQIVLQVIMPVMFKASKSDINKYRRINRVTWRYLAAFGIPAGVGMAMLADQIIPLIYTKPEYLASIPVLSVMGWFLAARFIGISQGSALTTQDKEHVRAWIQIVSVGLNIVLDIWLVTQYGAVGAAIATLITEIVIATSFIYASAKSLGDSLISRLKDMMPILAATLVMTAAITLANGNFHVILLVIFGAIVYLISLWLFRFFQPYDRKLLNELSSK